MSNRSGFYPCPVADAGGSMVVSQAGGLVLTETIRAVGLDRELSNSLARWRLPLAIHEPGKVVADLAVTLPLGGVCLADIALVRAEPGVYGLVASDPTVSRTIAASPTKRRRCWPRSGSLGRLLGRERGGWPASMPRTTALTGTAR